MSLLAAMFINKYKVVWRNLDAYKRFNIIKMKNSISFDKFIGGITLTFFPINILMVPLIPAILYFRNPRASDFLLKMQYGIMMLTYCTMSGIVIVPMAPVLYIKLVLNAIFIMNSNIRQAYPG
jgi:thiol:disulfide interchange protein